MHHAPIGPDRDAGRDGIRVRGRLDGRWTAWSDGLTVAHDPFPPTTRITFGPWSPP